MIAIAGGFALIFVAVCALVGRLEGGGVADALRRYAPTLIPIAAVYFMAHYFVYGVVYAQLTPKVVLDPLGRGWVPLRDLHGRPGCAGLVPAGVPDRVRARGGGVRGAARGPPRARPSRPRARSPTRPSPC